MPQPSHSFEDIERKVLAALCAGSFTRAERDSVLRRMANYNWHSPDHRVIYAALRRSSQTSAVDLQQDLIAEVTRLGFPDIEVAPFFVPWPLSKEEVAALLNQLLVPRAEPRH